METRQRQLLLLAAIAFIWYLYTNSSLGSRSSHAADTESEAGPANATLGFGAIVAVSRSQSPRRRPLLFAANITRLEVTIPEQPVWSEEDVTNILAREGSMISRGSALAWLGHLNALRWFLASGLETVVILEDDVDWDIHLRSTQIPAVAQAFRALTQSPLSSGYWGDTWKWEILYLGHCGDFFSPEEFEHTPKVLFQDKSLISRRRMHTKTQTWLRRLGFNEHERMVHQSRWPLCTFGYAVTRSSASRILNSLAAREPNGGCQAFDVRILEACRDLDYQCYSVNPELFHHIEAPSEIANVNQGIDDQGRLQRERTEGTPNIACGARSSSFLSDDGATLEFLMREVGERGMCLIDQMAEDNTRWP